MLNLVLKRNTELNVELNMAATKSKRSQTACRSRCKALASWSVNKPIKLVGSMANRKPGQYNAGFRRVVRKAKTTGLIAACRRACQSGFGSDGVGSEMRGPAYVTPFPGMDLPSAVFTAARVSKQKMAKRVPETQAADYTPGGT